MNGPCAREIRARRRRVATWLYSSFTSEISKSRRGLFKIASSVPAASEVVSSLCLFLRPKLAPLRIDWCCTYPSLAFQLGSGAKVRAFDLGDAGAWGELERVVAQYQGRRSILEVDCRSLCLSIKVSAFSSNLSPFPVSCKPTIPAIFFSNDAA
jgi:hypothetical protein